VRYDAVNAMLLNEFLKEHRKVEQQEATLSDVKTIIGKQQALIARQEKEIADLAANLKEQASQIEKVNQQLALRKSGADLLAANLK
jgi:septal ring factor EnvC (AmiA/AmiB activator)